MSATVLALPLTVWESLSLPEAANGSPLLALALCRGVSVVTMAVMALLDVRIMKLACPRTLISNRDTTIPAGRVWRLRDDSIRQLINGRLPVKWRIIKAGKRATQCHHQLPGDGSSVYQQPR